MLNPNFLLVHRNRYSEGMDDGQKTPRGHPDFHSYMKIQCVFIFLTEVSCFSVTLFYSTLLALTHRWNHRRRHLLRMGWRNPFFRLCCCVSFLFWREIGFGFTYYLCTQSTIAVVLCQFFGSGGKQFLVLRTYLVYNTVVQLCQFFCYGGKVNFVQIFLLCISFLLCMDLQPYRHDCFSKISRTFFDFLNNIFVESEFSSCTQEQVFGGDGRRTENSTWTPGFSFLHENSTCFHIPDRGFLFLRNTLLLYSLSPYSQMESQTEKQIHSLCVGQRNLFSSCAVVSVFCSGRK